MSLTIRRYVGCKLVALYWPCVPVVVAEGKTVTLPTITVSSDDLDRLRQR